MKQVKTFALTGLITIGAFAMIAYSSCGKKDACEDVVCKNNGTCVDGSCKCPTGYEGVDCGQTSAAKFTGLWAATDVCPISTRTGTDLKYHVTISTSNADPMQVDVKGIGATDYTFSATANGKTLTIDEQTAADGRKYSGTITYSNATTLSMSFSIKDSSGTPVEACTSTLKKS